MLEVDSASVARQVVAQRPVDLFAPQADQHLQKKGSCLFRGGSKELGSDTRQIPDKQMSFEKNSAFALVSDQGLAMRFELGIERTDCIQQVLGWC